MAKKVAIDHGHELTTPGKRTPAIPELNGRVIHENEFNKAVALKLMAILKRCGIDVIDVSDTDDDSLEDRVSRTNASNADIFVSIHYNAFDGKFDNYDPEGFSVHVYPTDKEAFRLAECVINHLKNGTPQRNRGIVKSNFHVLREVKCPAILTECGFMDNKREALLMLDEGFIQETAEEHAKGICDYFGIKYVDVPVSKYPSDLSSWAQPGYDFVIQNGISDGTNPKGNVTREQLWAMLARMHSLLGK